MPGDSAKASRSRRREDDCLRAELKIEFYTFSERIAARQARDLPLCKSIELLSTRWLRSAIDASH